MNNPIEQAMAAAILETTKINDGYRFKGRVDNLFEQVVDNFPKLEEYRLSFDSALDYLISSGVAVPHRHSGVQDYVVINRSESVEFAFLQKAESTEDLSSVFEGLFGPKNWKYHVVGSYLELGYEWLDDYIDSRFSNAAEEAASVMIPASDRAVHLDHNRPEYRELTDALDQAVQQAKETRPNQVSGDDHASLVAGLESARTLWNAFRLSQIQVEVGILLAVEKAEEILKTSFKLVKGPLLMEALRAFFRSAKNGDIL